MEIWRTAYAKGKHASECADSKSWVERQAWWIYLLCLSVKSVALVEKGLQSGSGGAGVDGEHC